MVKEFKHNEEAKQSINSMLKNYNTSINNLNDLNDIDDDTIKLKNESKYIKELYIEIRDDNIVFKDAEESFCKIYLKVSYNYSRLQLEKYRIDDYEFEKRSYENHQSISFLFEKEIDFINIFKLN